ncbi:MAG: ATP-grasp domain-containing protein [Planctomycetaceae bacterium]
MDVVKEKSDPILLWGIAGASLGMELGKCLHLGGYRNIVGCDISPVAYGHFSEIFQSTHLLDQRSVAESLEGILRKAAPKFVLAGGDQVARIIANYKEQFSAYGCQICANTEEVVALASDKYQVMMALRHAGFKIPETQLVHDATGVDGFPLPAVLKPRFDSGGSRGVVVVSTPSDLKAKCEEIAKSGVPYIVQQYISDQNGEYTIGVLSQTDGRVAGSILLHRTFHNMLSVHERTDHFLISSGSSQGIFERNESLQKQAEAMAQCIGSKGPLNIQARVYAGDLMIFEINPRFSASTFLRTLSGVNEADLYIRHLASGADIQYPQWNEGIALRTFGEVFVPRNQVPPDVF